MKIERVLVGVDGSANSRAAVQWAAGLASDLGSEVIAVHALGLLDRIDDRGQVATQPNRDRIREVFESSWCEPLDRAGVRCRRLTRDGHPVDVLLAVADEEGADLLVVGSRGLGDHHELLLGSTSTQVAQHSSRPVVIVSDPDPKR